MIAGSTLDMSTDPLVHPFYHWIFRICLRQGNAGIKDRQSGFRKVVLYSRIRPEAPFPLYVTLRAHLNDLVQLGHRVSTLTGALWIS